MLNMCNVHSLVVSTSNLPNNLARCRKITKLCVNPAPSTSKYGSVPPGISERIHYIK